MHQVATFPLSSLRVSLSVIRLPIATVLTYLGKYARMPNIVRLPYLGCPYLCQCWLRAWLFAHHDDLRHQ